MGREIEGEGEGENAYKWIVAAGDESGAGTK